MEGRRWCELMAGGQTVGHNTSNTHPFFLFLPVDDNEARPLCVDCSVAIVPGMATVP